MDVRYLLLLTLSVVFFVPGCQEKTPEGFPKLIKNASVTVIQDGNPLADAKVTLYSDDPAIKWTIGGKTDANGAAKLVTHGQYPGAPAGTFQVTVSKREEPQYQNQTPAPGQSDAEFMAARAAENLSAYQLVDLSYGQRKTTKAVVEISDSNPGGTVDVGKAVREPIKESP